ncbi:uncharacterized protein LOC100906390 [Galendromus occidentalis]|uniref:Uncharacterized protein LOC100906390 n=1 Tax=Galendromus occidentalis TaxID=34638 RepID=A0AAJ6QNU8_9ACAR|nr:uncharacterized protein LOC100906390 [Galendromus occidentalis]
MKLFFGISVLIGLWALTVSSEPETNRTSEAETPKNKTEPEALKISLQDRPREGRGESKKIEETPKHKDDGDADESKEESSERQVRSRVPYGYKPGIQGGPRGLPHAPVNFGSFKRVPSENQSDSALSLFEKNMNDCIHRLHNEVRGLGTKPLLRSPPAIRPLPQNQADPPFIGPQPAGPLVGRGPVYPALNKQQNHRFPHGPMQLTQGGFRPTFGPHHQTSPPGFNNDFNGLFRPFGLRASSFGISPGSEERFTNALDTDVPFNHFGPQHAFSSLGHNSTQFGVNHFQSAVDFNGGFGPLANFGGSLNGVPQSLGFSGLINSAENDFIGFGGNAFGSRGFGNGNPTFDGYFQGFNSNPFPVDAGDMRIQSNSLGDGGAFSSQAGDVMSNAMNHHAGVARSPMQSLTQHATNIPRPIQPIFPAAAANAQNPTAGLSVPMPPTPADNRPYSILPGGNFHSAAKSASDIHYVNRPFMKPPCASSRKNVTFCVKDDQYPRDSVVQSAFSDPLTARRLVPYIPDEELVSAESNDVKMRSSLSEACSAETNLIRPMRAKNTKGMWKVIVNVDTPLNGQQYKQLIHTETCRKTGAQCHASRKSVCVQKFTMHRLAAWSPQEGLHMDSFRFPIACSCLLA